ncbi:10908_t:CDS:2 [Racocetra persica]|uniref:10908_t:CDS:1 n=1 Tax=Racocetra persica TaxID=160502 RepID=A0ACA9P5E5_9GLOM|nr:10908_t:CDS:2 [Racocetra persica]
MTNLFIVSLFQDFSILFAPDFQWREHPAKWVQTRLQVLSSFLICGQITPKLSQKLIHEGYKYVDRLSDYLEDIGTMYVREFELDPLADFYYPALILPLFVLAIRADIHKKFIISVESAVMNNLGARRNENLEE